MALSIHTEAFITMQKHAEKSFPNECCGFFYGRDGAVRQITVAREVPNSKEGDQKRRFEISPEDYMKAEKFALDNNLDLLGIYHSHPQHPAIPSEHDLKQAVPWFSYIILSVMDARLDHARSWILTEENTFEEEEILTIN